MKTHYYDEAVDKLRPRRFRFNIFRDSIVLGILRTEIVLYRYWPYKLSLRRY